MNIASEIHQLNLLSSIKGKTKLLQSLLINYIAEK